MRSEQLSEDVTVYNADCRDLLGELASKAQGLVTDIPYEISQGGGNIRHIDFGAWDGAGSSDIALEALVFCYAIPSVVVFCGWQQTTPIFNLFGEDRSTRLLVWSKTNPTVMNGQHMFLPAVETAYYGKLSGAWFGGHCVRSVWTGPAPQAREHPTQKPLDLMKWVVHNTVEPGTTVLDPFMGSGTTGVASVQLGRKFLGVEKDAKHFETACRRIGAATKQPDMFTPKRVREKPAQLEL